MLKTVCNRGDKRPRCYKNNEKVKNTAVKMHSVCVYNLFKKALSVSVITGILVS